MRTPLLDIHAQEAFVVAEWQVVAFPVILSWREEFWTLPLYFPDLKVGVIPGWSDQLPYQGLPLPPEAESQRLEVSGFKRGELHQWHAFQEYHHAQEDREDDLIQAIRRGQAAVSSSPGPLPDAWHLAWQIEKILTDQEARLASVNRGEKWLAEILAPEPWEERVNLGPVPSIGEIVDPAMAKLRYRIWQRVMATYLQNQWAPLLLSHTARSIFLALRGWPKETRLRTVQISLPGCRSEKEWLQIRNSAGMMETLDKCRAFLALALTKATGSPDLAAASLEFTKFVKEILVPRWLLPSPWQWHLEIWAPDPEEGEEGTPVLCWAGAGVLPG